MDDVKYREETVISLPNGDEVPAVVEVRGRGDTVWTRITPTIPVVIPTDGIGEECGDEHDYLHDLETRGVRTAAQMQADFTQEWERAYA